MIKQTFYNLPEEKRKRVVSAVIAEFSESEDEKISINRIIKRAGISRGSFYQYFDDKVDLVEVLQQSFAGLVWADAETLLNAADGDVFDTYAKLFDTVVSLADDAHKRSILRRLLRNLHANDDLVSEYVFNRFQGGERNREAYKRFSREGLRFQSDADLELLVQIICDQLKNAMFAFYVLEESREKVRGDYLRKLEIIKAGAAVKI